TALLSQARFVTVERPLIRLWQLIGALSALYGLAHYPLFPPIPGDTTAAALYALLVTLWLASLACGVLCFRIPSLAMVPPAFLLWSALAASRITGLRHDKLLDIAPLPEIAFCIGLGLAISQVQAKVARGDEGTREHFARVLLLVAIGIHFANYFWSAVTKASLDGPPLAWVTQNNPVRLFLVAWDNDHLFFAENPAVFRFLSNVIDKSHLLTNVLILSAQALAVAAFFLPKRLILLLLTVYDLMHASIIVVAGANFWPWILLNVAVGIVVASREFERPKPLAAAGAALFIVISPHFVNVAWLGWYDSGANNKLFFEAEDTAGRRYYVPTNLFAFYSYPLAHMDYGSPQPETAFSVGSPSGWVQSYRLFQAGLQCNPAALTQPDSHQLKARPMDPHLDQFVRDYHHMVLALQRYIGALPYDACPHHLYIGWGRGRDFGQLDKRDIRAYIYRRESVCMSWQDGLPVRKILSTAEHRIDVQ
ncbi:MAG TPA: hypothetical protein VFN42_05815, partial [Acetobacteraceae bacterium]|nr:hypothetical protein [Acetobacteraceae bacterium]